MNWSPDIHQHPGELHTETGAGLHDIEAPGVAPDLNPLDEPSTGTGLGPVPSRAGQTRLLPYSDGHRLILTSWPDENALAALVAMLWQERHYVRRLSIELDCPLPTPAYRGELFDAVVDSLPGSAIGFWHISECIFKTRDYRKNLRRRIVPYVTGYHNY